MVATTSVGLGGIALAMPSSRALEHSEFPGRLRAARGTSASLRRSRDSRRHRRSPRPERPPHTLVSAAGATPAAAVLHASRRLRSSSGADYRLGMADPSDYERRAWRELDGSRNRPLSRVVRGAGAKASTGTAEVGRLAAGYLGKHPRTQSALERTQAAVVKGGALAGSGARAVADALPDWSGTALTSFQRTAARASRAGLSPSKVVARHVRHGHDVVHLSDLRRLDLEQIDAVRGRGPKWYYPALAALSGAGAGLVISGGEFVTATSSGAAAGPSFGAIAGAFAGDAAFVLGLGSRAVGHVSLLYGYDPDEPTEKLFVLSVVNAGSATTAAAKAAAMADLSRLTQALVRGKPWAVLNESVLTRVAKQFAEKFGTRLTKQGLGKAVPAAGIVIGGTLNWATVESIVDAADLAYRRRFLIEKYPQLGGDGVFGRATGVESSHPDDTDETISVLGELRAAGGPELA